MKIGIRKPSLKKSLKASTTGRLNRLAKRAINPLYGKKGMGIINNPKKHVYNKVYNKTTTGIRDNSSSTIKNINVATEEKSESVNYIKISIYLLTTLLGVIFLYANNWLWGIILLLAAIITSALLESETESVIKFFTAILLCIVLAINFKSKGVFQNAIVLVTAIGNFLSFSKK